MYSNIIALIVTFFICGLWHGAGWNFILWGPIHGVMMSFALPDSKPKAKLYQLLKIQIQKILHLFQVIITFQSRGLLFLVFRSHDVQTVIDIFRR